MPQLIPQKKRSTPPPPRPAPQPITSYKSPSLLSTMAEGMAFGTGSSLAREAVSSIFHKQTIKETPSYCEKLKDQLTQCVIGNHFCDNIADLYKTHCETDQKNEPTFGF